VTSLAELAATVMEMCRVLPTVPRVESARRRLGPRAALDDLRRRGRSSPRRQAFGRRCLCRAIRLVDRLMPGGANCYRRALLEIALDRGAAADPLLLGFMLQGDQLSGHAWLGSEANAEPYHFTVQL
jgi:hypothetical protein